MTLVDSNVLLDSATEDATWSGWSAEALARAIDLGQVCVNPVVYAEVSTRSIASSTSTPSCPSPCSAESHCPTAPSSSPERPFSPTEGAVESVADPSPTSTSVRTPQWVATGC